MPTRLKLAILLGLIVVAVTSFGLSAGAAPEAEDEVGAAQQRLAEMRMEASSAYEAHDNAVLQLSELDEEIVAVSHELGKAEGDLAESQGRLEERAAQMYKSGNVGFLDVLVGSEEFSDFAERLDLWMRLMAQERAEFEKVREARDQIAERKASLEATRERRAAAVGEADDQIDRAAQLEEESQAYLDSLNAELREAMEAEQAEAAERAEQRGREIRDRIAKAEPEAVREEPVAEEPVAVEPAAEEPVAEEPVAEEPVAEEPEPIAEKNARAETPVEPPAPIVSNVAARQAAADRAAEKAAAERYAAEKAAAAKEARRQAEAAKAAEEARLREEAIVAERRAQRAEERAAAQAEAEAEARRQAKQQAAAEAAQEQAAQQQLADPGNQPAGGAAGGAGEDQYAGSGGGQPGNNAGGGQPAGGGQDTGAGGASASGSAVVAEAATYMGVPYSLNSCSRDTAVDCSCFTMLVYQEFGISLVDSPAAQFGSGAPVSGAPMAGDLVFWNEDGSGITHVGIATGNGTTIHASAFAGYVTETPIDSIPGYVGARRLL